MQYCKKNDTVLWHHGLPSSPIYPLCDLCFVAKSNIVSFVDTLVAPISLINALISGWAENEAETKKVSKIWKTCGNEYLNVLNTIINAGIEVLP
jgi:hypothetical protein